MAVLWLFYFAWNTIWTSSRHGIINVQMEQENGERTILYGKQKSLENHT